MDKDLKTNIILHFTTQNNNTFKEIAQKYNVSLYEVGKIINKYWQQKECKHQFYEIDNYSSLKQCRLCDQLKT